MMGGILVGLLAGLAIEWLDKSGREDAAGWAFAILMVSLVAMIVVSHHMGW